MGMYRSELFLYPPMGGLRIERSRKEPCGLRTSCVAPTDNGRRVQPLLAASRQQRLPSKDNVLWRRFQGVQAAYVAQVRCATDQRERAALFCATTPHFAACWDTITR